MNELNNLICDLNSVLMKYRAKPIQSGEMIRLAQNPDEITLFVPTTYKNKNIVIIYIKD